MEISFENFKQAQGESLPSSINNFFKEHNDEAPFAKPDFLSWTQPFNKYQFKHVKKMFRYINLKFDITNDLEPKIDVKTDEYIIWCHFEMVNGKRKLPIPYHEGLLKFLIRYQEVGGDFGETDHPISV